MPDVTAPSKARDIQRNAQGHVQFQQADTQQVTATATGTPETGQASTTGRVQYGKVSADFTVGSGNLTIKRGGTTITNGTGPVSATETVRETSPVWTLTASWTAGVGDIPIDTYSNTNQTSTVSGSTEASTVLSGSGQSVYVYGSFTGVTTFKLKVNGNTIQSTSTPGTITEITTGIFTNPSVTWYANNFVAPPPATINTKRATLYGTVTGQATLTASKNQVTTVS